MTAYLLLAADCEQARKAADAYGLAEAYYPRTAREAITVPSPFTVVRVEGWERSAHQTVAVATIAERTSSDELDLPDADYLRHGIERAERAADDLARRRQAKATGSPFLDPQEPVRTTAIQIRHAATLGQRVAHAFGLCPTRRAGLPCRYAPATCRWP